MNKHATHLTTALALVASVGGARLQARADDTPPALTATAYAEAVYVPVGVYVGTCSGPAVSSGSLPFRAEIVQAQGRNQARLICSQPGENCYEDWIWDDTSISVTRHVFIPGNQMPDRRMHEEVSQLRGYMSGGRYRVVCQDPEGIDCGMGLSAGSYLTIATTADGFRCEVWQHQVAPPSPQMALLLQAFEFDRAQ